MAAALLPTSFRSFLFATLAIQFVPFVAGILPLLLGIAQLIVGIIAAIFTMPGQVAALVFGDFQIHGQVVFVGFWRVCRTLISALRDIMMALLLFLRTPVVIVAVCAFFAVNLDPTTLIAMVTLLYLALENVILIFANPINLIIIVLGVLIINHQRRLV